MKTIQPNARVVLEYTLKNDKGEVLDSSDAEDGEPIVYVHGYGMLVPGLEAALAGLETGAAKDVTVSPEEGFGERDDELVLEIDRGDFPDPKKVEVDDEVVAESPDGDEVPMRVVEVKDDTVVVDANHPLAGVTLRYSVLVKEVAAASEDEIAEAASGFEEAGYGEDGGCNDPTHDHSHGHGHGHSHDHDHAKKPGDLVQLSSKKPS
jgi:FKBP-type peptidyl-prolyl cis-trans isomerase SlyD